MSRFAKKSVTGKLSLGECQCPDAPHEEDWIRLRSEIGAAEALEIGEWELPAVLGYLAVEWNLLDDDGEPAPLEQERIDLLFADEIAKFRVWLKANLRTTALPKGSAARSPNSQRASGSRTPTALKAG